MLLIERTEHYEVYVHDGMRATITHTPLHRVYDEWIDEKFEVDLRIADGIPLLCIDCSSWEDSRKRIAEKFEFPQSILILKHATC